MIVSHYFKHRYWEHGKSFFETQTSCTCCVRHLVAGLLGSVTLSPAAVASLSPGRAASLGAGAVPHAASLFLILPAGVARGGDRHVFVSPAILHRLWTCMSARLKISPRLQSAGTSTRDGFNFARRGSMEIISGDVIWLYSIESSNQV